MSLCSPEGLIAIWLAEDRLTIAQAESVLTDGVVDTLAEVLETESTWVLTELTITLEVVDVDDLGIECEV